MTYITGPLTRISILDPLVAWSAGAGKSAIMQTLCQRLRRPVASAEPSFLNGGTRLAVTR
ncbi:hypothetical protein B0H17DRAFT_1109247, partial [Mycena rosella]